MNIIRYLCNTLNYLHQLVQLQQYLTHYPKWDRTTEFKEIRKVLDPNGSTELFQYDYFEHPTFRSKEWLAKYQYETEDLMTEKEWLKKHQLNKEKN